MKTRIVLTGCLTLAAAALLVGQMNAEAGPRGSAKGGVAGIGPDVIPGDINGPFNWGGLTVSGVPTAAYSIGTTSCNIGDAPLEWIQTLNRHPLMPQNIYRYEMVNGVSTFKHIGLSWLKHAFCALQGTLCGGCPKPACGGCCSALAPGCSDPYTAQRNGSQSLLGPRYQVNATTGAYPYPFDGSTPASTVLHRRCQVANSDIDPALHPGAIFWGEAQYVHPQDAAAGLGLNNASHRRLVVGAFTGTMWNLSSSGVTIRMIPALHEWQLADPTVIEQNVDVPGDGRYVVSYDTTDLGSGRTRFEYVIYNINSHRSGESFAVPLPAGVTLSNISFSGPKYHSGEPPNNIPWTATTSGGFIKWATEAFDPGGANQHSAYALRFATAYSFGFTANAPPVDAAAVFDLFRPGAPDTMSFIVKGPGAPTGGCLSDVDGSGCTNGVDLAAVLNAWTGAAVYASCLPAIAVDLNHDCKVNGLDLGALLAGWGPCAGGVCP